MVQVNRITGGSDEFISLIRGIQARVSNLETRGTGSIFMSEQIATRDPASGVETIFGALPDGTYGFQQWINDTEPPNAPSTPIVNGDRAVFEIIWDGMDLDGFNQPEDYDRTVVQMTTTSPELTLATWVEVNYFIAAGRVIVGGQPYGQPRYFRLVSYDKTGNASAPSAYASATLVSYMESPEMTSYVNTVESDISSANSAASAAQTAANEAATKAENAEKLAQSAASSATSMVKNGSFEFDFESWEKESANGTITTETAYEGAKSWKIDTNGSGIYQAPIPVTEGSIYVFEMQYKTIAGYAGSGGLRLQTSTDGTAFTNAVNGTCTENIDWVSQTVEYTVAPGVTHIRPRIAFASATTMGAWVDVVKLTDVTNMRRLEKLAQDAKNIADAASQKAEDAARDAGNALTSADGKNTIWRQDTQPAGTSHKVNDVWFNTADGNKTHIWNGTAWVLNRDTDIAKAINDAFNAGEAASTASAEAASASSAAETATNVANSASSAASDASAKADSAFTAANGKNKITTSSNAAPTTYTGAVGDMWWQKRSTAPFDVIKQSTWNGTSWDAQVLGSDVIDNLNAGKLNAGTLASDRIRANSIGVEKLVIGDLTNLWVDVDFSTGSGMSNAAVYTGTEVPPLGRKAIQIGARDHIGTRRIPVKPGEHFRISWTQKFVAGTVALNTAIWLENKDGTKGANWSQWSANSPTYASTPTMVMDYGNGWARYTRTVRIDEAWTDVQRAGLYFQLNQYSPYTTTVLISDIDFRRMNGGSLIVDGSITSAHILANSIRAEDIQSGTITADSGIIASIDAAKISVGEMEGARIKAGTIFADRLVVGSGNNLIANPEFTANSTLTNARIAGSTPGAVWSSPDYIGWNATTATAGILSLKIGGQASNVTHPTFPVIANRRYRVGWTVYADAITSTTTRVTYRWLNRGGTITTSVGADKPLTATGVTSYQDEVVAPAEATHVALALEFSGHPGGGWLDFRQPSMQLMTDGTIITENTILTKHIAAGQITGDIVDASYIRGQVITGDMFEGKTFAGGIFQQATFETSPLANTGAKMSPTLGFVGYNADKELVFQVDPNGNAVFKGQVMVTEGSTIPQTAVVDLTNTLSNHSRAVDTVWGWADPRDTTLINGGNIATNSITANQIALGSGQNFITGGDGGDRRGWGDFGYEDTNSAWPSNVQSLYTLNTKKLAYGPSFSVSALNKYSFSYSFASGGPTILHEAAIVFYDINNAYISIVRLGRKASSGSYTMSSASVSNQTAPSNAVYARVYVEHNWQTGDAVGLTKFADWRLTTGTETRLTASGLSSYNAGTQTLRLNGDDNLMIGEILTGRPGKEPYIKLSSRTSVAAIDFYSIDGTDQTNHGAMWWQTATDNTAIGELKIYAMDDAPVIEGNRYYAAGIELRSSGFMEFHGRLSHRSEIKTGSTTWASPGFGAEGTSNSYGTYRYTFGTAYAGGITPRVIISMEASAGAEVVATVKNVTNSYFEYIVVNMAPRSSGFTRMNFIAVRE